MSYVVSQQLVEKILLKENYSIEILEKEAQTLTNILNQGYKFLFLKPINLFMRPDELRMNQYYKITIHKGNKAPDSKYIVSDVYNDESLTLLIKKLLLSVKHKDCKNFQFKIEDEADIIELNKMMLKKTISEYDIDQVNAISPNNILFNKDAAKLFTGLFYGKGAYLPDMNRQTVSLTPCFTRNTALELYFLSFIKNGSSTPAHYIDKRAITDLVLKTNRVTTDIFSDSNKKIFENLIFEKITNDVNKNDFSLLASMFKTYISIEKSPSNSGYINRIKNFYKCLDLVDMLEAEKFNTFTEYFIKNGGDLIFLENELNVKYNTVEVEYNAQQKRVIEIDYLKFAEAVNIDPGYIQYKLVDSNISITLESINKVKKMIFSTTLNLDGLTDKEIINEMAKCIKFRTLKDTELTKHFHELNLSNKLKANNQINETYLKKPKI